MSDEPPVAVRLADFLRQRRACGDDGKTFLLGLRAATPVFAVAAGLRGAADHARWLRFARYLLHRRFDCDGFGLLLPAMIDGEQVYALEWRAQGRHAVELVLGDGGRRPAALDGDLVGDLSLRGEPLPGILRRELDALFQALAVPLA